MFFSSRSKKLRKQASHLVQLANKVINYRKDVLSEAALADIQRDAEALLGLVKTREIDTKQVEAGIKQLDKTLSPHGGTIYPVTFWGENIEMVLVAAILAIGVRSFFLQPFKIPTNSMYPTYAGMVGEVYVKGEDAPGPVADVFRFITLGAKHYSEEAPASGKVEIPIWTKRTTEGTVAMVAFETVDGRSFFVLPSQKRKYTFKIDGKPFTVTVPLNFGLDNVVTKTFFPGAKNITDAVVKYGHLMNGAGTILSKERFEKGEPVIDFDLLTGDMLFVDRFSYNFFEPEIGDPFVFRTDKIAGLVNQQGEPDDKYYIKRLVGIPGDTLEVKPPYLYRDGEPIEGADAFERNFQQEGLYAGYSYMGWMQPGVIEKIPEGYFYAMGDNSPESKDSRGWFDNPYAVTEKQTEDAPVNMVPEKEVVGKAVFIFYPFSSRWGIAE